MPSETVLQHNRRYIPGGISSVNRSIDPAITFVRGEGAYLWDNEGKRYIDYHAGFAPYFLGHNFAPINQAAATALTSGDSLFGAGPSIATVAWTVARWGGSVTVCEPRTLISTVVMALTICSPGTR